MGKQAGVPEPKGSEAVHGHRSLMVTGEFMVPWWLCAAGQQGPVVPMCAGKAAERVSFCRAHGDEGQVTLGCLLDAFLALFFCRPLRCLFGAARATGGFFPWLSDAEVF